MAREALQYLALLRGINVGGKNCLPMQELVKFFSEVGCRDISTFIQSGNVIFHAAPSAAAQVPEAVSEKIAKRFGYKTPVVLRTTEEMRRVLAGNPFLKAGVAEDELHVMFLADSPGAKRVQELDPDRSPPDRFEIRGREVYLHLPNGAGRSKLTNAYFDTKLATVGTQRNWRTVTKLVELMQRTGLT